MVRPFQKGVHDGFVRVGGHGVIVVQPLPQRHIHAQVVAVLNGQEKFGQLVRRVFRFICPGPDAVAQRFCQVRALQILAQRHHPVARKGEPMSASQQPKGAFHRQKRLHAGKQVELVVGQ